MAIKAVATPQACEAARLVWIAQADARAAALAPNNRRDTGERHNAPYSIAAALTARSIPTAQGHRFWMTAQVRSILNRLDRLSAGIAMKKQSPIGGTKSSEWIVPKLLRMWWLKCNTMTTGRQRLFPGTGPKLPRQSSTLPSLSLRFGLQPISAPAQILWGERRGDYIHRRGGRPRRDAGRRPTRPDVPSGATYLHSASSRSRVGDY
jgi:hypothetical protein